MNGPSRKKLRGSLVASCLPLLMQWTTRPRLIKSNSFSILVFGERSLLSFDRESCKGETKDDSEVDEQDQGEGCAQDELDTGEGEGLILSSPLFLEVSGMFP